MSQVTFRNAVAENTTVMVCKHIWERSSCKVVIGGAAGPDYSRHLIERYATPTQFTREDGSMFRASFQMRCPRCARTHARNVDFIETTWKDGRMHTSDFMRAG